MRKMCSLFISLTGNLKRNEDRPQVEAATPLDGGEGWAFQP
jgi:hypothetical protein